MRTDLDRALAQIAASAADDAATDRMLAQVGHMVGRVRRRRAARHATYGAVGVGTAAAVAVVGVQLGGPSALRGGPTTPAAGPADGGTARGEVTPVPECGAQTGIIGPWLGVEQGAGADAAVETPPSGQRPDAPAEPRGVGLSTRSLPAAESGAEVPVHRSTLVAEDVAGTGTVPAPGLVLLEEDGTVVTAGATLVRSTAAGPRDGWAQVTDHVLALSLVDCRTGTPLEPGTYLSLTVLEAVLGRSTTRSESVGEAVVLPLGDADAEGRTTGDARYLEAERALARIAEERARERAEEAGERADDGTGG